MRGVRGVMDVMDGRAVKAVGRGVVDCCLACIAAVRQQRTAGRSSRGSCMSVCVGGDGMLERRLRGHRDRDFWSTRTGLGDGGND